MPLDEEKLSEQAGHIVAGAIVVIDAENDFAKNPCEKTDKAVENAQKQYDAECDALLEMVREQMDG